MKTLGPSIRVRRSPSFSGRAIKLDGVSDFIDLRTGFAFGNTDLNSLFYSFGRGRPSTNQFSETGSWMLWVKFTEDQINAVNNERISFGEGIYPIVKESGAHDTVSVTNWAGCHIWLVGVVTGE